VASAAEACFRVSIVSYGFRRSGERRGSAGFCDQYAKIHNLTSSALDGNLGKRLGAVTAEQAPLIAGAIDRIPFQVRVSIEVFRNINMLPQSVGNSSLAAIDSL
jgi:hypothetical protein